MRFKLINKIFRTYLHFVHNRIFYHSIQHVGQENIPTDGSGVVLVSNHQNALGDPFIFETAFGLRQITIFAMGAVAGMPVVGAFLRWMGVLPAYRLRTDGEGSLYKNASVFREAGRRLMGGEIVAIYPEATNQTRRWLGTFSEGYLRMAFDAAETENFKKEVYIVPSAVHYNNYYNMQSDAVIVFGRPIALSDYYEEYQRTPRTARRDVNHLVRERVHEMMLDVRDTENYEAIDYILNRERRRHERTMADNLKAEKTLLRHIEAKQATDPERMKEIFAKTLELKAFTLKHGLRDWLFDAQLSWGRVLAMWLLMLLSLPVFLFALIPNLLVMLAPEPLVKLISKIGEKFVLFASGVRYGVSTLLTMPVLYIATFLIEGFCLSWWLAVPHLLLEPALLLFAYRYHRLAHKLLGATRFLCRRNSPEMKQMTETRNLINKYIYG